MKLFFFLFALPLTALAQSGNNDDSPKGIHFLQGISWNQVLQQAKSEGKNIFLDCYTTWCAPCKKMEKEVYSDDSVADFFNRNFICYKLQLDSTKNDNEEVKRTYADAGYIRSTFKVYSYPTLLFFSPYGKILNRKEGFMEVEDFFKIGEDALDPKKNYYHLLDEYNKGKKDLEEMKTIVRTAQLLLKDTVTAKKVSKDFMQRLPKSQYLADDNIDFIKLITRSSKDFGFKFFYDNTDTINKIMDDKMYSQSVIKSIIFAEMVYPDVIKARDSGTEPNWVKLQQSIKQRYNAYYADLVITAIRLDWSKLQKDWKQYTKMVVKYVDNYVVPTNKQGHWPAFALNNFAWDLFRFSDDKNDLSRALMWSSKAVMMDPNPNWMDTYANILYKMGDLNLALKWEEMANQLAKDDTVLKNNLKNMKEGKPTWPIHN